MGKSMGNRKCEWIGARLPLWVDNGDCDGSTEAHGERGDLSGSERQQIEQHLAGCTSVSPPPACSGTSTCCTRRLPRTTYPVISDAPSLWPLLEQRITDS